MIEFDEYKVKLNNIRPKLDALSDSLGIEAVKEEIERLHAQIDSDGFAAQPESIPTSSASARRQAKKRFTSMVILHKI